MRQRRAADKAISQRRSVTDLSQRPPVRTARCAARVDTDFGLVSLTNTTISGNSASEGGGGIYADKGTHLQISFSTITNNNAAPKGGGGVLLYNDLDAETRINGTIIAGNSPHDVAAVERKSVVCCSQGFNLIGSVGPYIDLGADFGQTGDVRNVADAKLGALGNNGGPTQTHGLLAGSPALNTGGSTGPTTDQRSVTRPSSLKDKGAFEAAAGSLPATQAITFAQPASPQPLGASFSIAPTASSSLAVTVGASGACSISGLVVTMTSPTGACTLTATQNGNGSFLPAAPVTRVVAARKAAQNVTFTSSPPSPATSGGTYTPTANGGASGNPVTFGATGSCSYDGGTGKVTLAAGSCTVSADQAGDANYLAGHAEQTFTVGAASGIAFQSRSNGQNNGSATTLEISRPAGVASGDFLLAQITFEKGSDLQVTAPLGWALVLRTNHGSDIGQAIYRKTANGSEPFTYQFTFSQSVKAAGGILRYTGVNAANPIVASSGRTGVSNALTANSITAANNGMLVALFGFKKKEVTLSVPTGMTGRYNFENPNDLTIGADDERRTTWPTTTGNRTSNALQPGSTSGVTEKFVAQLVMLRAN